MYTHSYFSYLSCFYLSQILGREVPVLVPFLCAMCFRNPYMVLYACVIVLTPSMENACNCQGAGLFKKKIKGNCLYTTFFSDRTFFF